jgi:pantetheine-phosphate adenylyltransferase
MGFKYHLVIVGGTFDRFHRGHEKLVDKAFAVGEQVEIGVCQKNMHQGKPLAKIIESYKERKKSVSDYLIRKGWEKRGTIIPLTDIYGSARTNKQIEAVVVTEKTYHNAEKVNALRKKLGFKPMAVELVPLLRGDDNEVITSERIRLGEIDRKGQTYIKLFDREKLILPQELRNEARKPVGKVIGGVVAEADRVAEKIVDIIKNQKPTITVSVGDFITMSLLRAGFNPDVEIIDFKTRRKEIRLASMPIFPAVLRKIYHRLKRDFLLTRNYVKNGKSYSIKEYVNAPGTINKQAVIVLKRCLNNYLSRGKKQQLIIKGEEDLIALPAILLAPINSLVIYGHFELGVVLVEVTEEVKEKIRNLLLFFA